MPRLLPGPALPLLALLLAGPPALAAPLGYYRQPALHGDTLVFVSEGDLWKVSARGGKAVRLTSHAGDEGLPAISPDGKVVAYVASYEGAPDVHTLPLEGGKPARVSYDASRITFVGWSPGGKLLYSTDRYSGLPNVQLVSVDLAAPGQPRERLPLDQAAEGCYGEDGRTLFFTRLPFQGSHTKRYRGGTAQNLWKFAPGDADATPLTKDYPGTSKSPLWWKGRVYFVTDRGGSMNLWSMRPDGGDPRALTSHKEWDVASPSLSGGKIAYQLGADLHLVDIESGKDARLDITLESDLDQNREKWVTRPVEYLSSAHLSPTGDRVALTARGRVFVAPARAGRLVETGKPDGVRHRDARFLPDGKSLLALSDESGEVELWELSARGLGKPAQLTSNGDVLRGEFAVSPDGKWVAHADRNHRLHLLELATRKDRLVDESKVDEFRSLTWSPDSRWLAYVAPAANSFTRIKVRHVAEEKVYFATSDRYDSFSPAWSPDGKWLYFLSDRNLKSVTESPWGSYQPEPFLDRKARIYHLALTPGLRSPFEPPDETSAPRAEKAPEEKPREGKGGGPEKKAPPKGGVPVIATPGAVSVVIVAEGLAERLQPVPVPPGNYTRLSVNDKALFWVSSPAGGEGKAALQSVPVVDQDAEVKTVADDVKHHELSGDGKKLLLRLGGDRLAVVDAAPGPAALAKKDVDLAGWSLAVTPRDEWRQMFDEAWRLERDYFYDRGMHGVDWKKVRDRYRPLVDRVQSRAELSDLLAQMVSELSALHIFVRGGDGRQGPDSVSRAGLGALLERDEKAGGFRVRHVHRSDPDEPEAASPLARPGVNVKAGDVITAVNGTPALGVADLASLLRNRAGRQVLLEVKSGAATREVVVRPLSPEREADLRYHEWEYTRRLEVDEKGNKEIGYVHLRAMGNANFTEWARGFYPVYTRQGLIVDVRNNRGGNIDSWILGRLLRKSWFYWSQRVGQAPTWNMQYAFRGHVVVLCNEWTASDGEAFAEGARRLGIGKVIGTRTWGGEIWLTSSNFLVDKGIATSAEFGVYGPEGAWLIEGHGVEPDLVVDNLPHATFRGKDAQLEAAIAYLQKRIKESPVVIPPPPRHPTPAGKGLPGRAP